MPPEETDGALRARLALLGHAPSPDEPELEHAFALFAERMRLLGEAAADLGPADPPYLAPPAPAVPAPGAAGEATPVPGAAREAAPVIPAAPPGPAGHRAWWRRPPWCAAARRPASPW